jgi:hypothetical protein
LVRRKGCEEGLVGRKGWEEGENGVGREKGVRGGVWRGGLEEGLVGGVGREKGVRGGVWRGGLEEGLVGGVGREKGAGARDFLLEVVVVVEGV